MILLWCGLGLAMTPDEAVRAATANDPALAGAEAEVLSATGARRSASWLRANPEVALAAAVGGGRLEASVTQDVSIAGAGIADARIGRYAVEAAEAGLTRARLETAAEARRAWAQLAAAEGALRAAEGERASARAVRAAAEARRAAGEASDLELELARLDEARAAASWLAAVDQRADARVALAALTGDAGASAGGDPLAAVPTAGAGAGHVRSDVSAAEARVAAARAAVVRERAEAIPALGVGAFVEVDGERTLAGPSVRVEVPFWQQNAAGRSAARADLLVAEAQAAAARARADAEQRTAAERLDALAESGASLAPGVDASAEAALQAIDAGVAGGELDPAQAALLRARVFEGQRGWYAARLAEAEGRIDAALANEEGGLLAP